MLQSTLFAQVSGYSKIADQYILTGTINGKYAITMYLTVDSTGSKASGRYYYHSQKKYMDLEGSTTRSGIILEEKDENANMTGEFVGVFNTSTMTFSGNWGNAKTQKSMPFSLSKNSSIPISRMEIFKDRNEVENSKYYPKLYSDSSSRGVNIINREIEAGINEHIKYDRDCIYEYGSDSYESFYDYDFVYADNNIVTVRSSIWMWTGGAHGNGASLYYIYNIRTGKELSRNTDELIVSKNNTSVINLLRKKLLIDYDENDFFDFDDIELSERFYVDIDGIHFYYGPYELGSYSLGNVNVSFTFAELKPFVNRSNPFYYLFE